MKYRFAGGQDVPEWILAEVSVLSKISCVRLKLICRQVILELCGGDIDFEKIMKLVPKDSGFSPSDIKATVAAISFILTNATRHAVDQDVLNSELQQLGLPRENSDGISRPFRIYRDRLRDQAAANSLRLPRLVAVQARVDAIYGSSACGSLAAASAAGAGGLATVLHLSLGLSHTLHSARGRVRAGDGDASQLQAVQAAATAASASACASSAHSETAVAGVGSSGRMAAFGSSVAFDAAAAAAMAALGISVLVPPQAPSPASPLAAGAGPLSPLSQIAVVGGGAAGLQLQPAAWAHLTASEAAARALLAELRVARAVLATVTSAMAPVAPAAASAASGSAGAGNRGKARAGAGLPDADDDGEF